MNKTIFDDSLKKRYTNEQVGIVGDQIINAVVKSMADGIIISKKIALGANWTKTLLVEKLAKNSIRPMVELPDLISPIGKFKIPIKCLLCGNSRDRTNKGQWLLQKGRFDVRCPKCHSREGRISIRARNQRYTLNDLNKKLRKKRIRITSSLPTSFIGKTCVNLKCTKPQCLNDKARDGSKAWKVKLYSIYNNRTKCAKCTGSQQLTKSELEILLEKKFLKLIKRPKYARDKIEALCLKCNTTVSLPWYQIKLGQRNCNCKKHACRVFENELRKILGVRSGGPDQNRADCFIKDQGVYIEAKFGNNGLTGWSPGGILDQAKRYLKTGYKIIYLINCPRDKSVKPFPLPEIEHYFLDEFDKFQIAGKFFTETQIEVFRMMYEHPDKFSDVEPSSDYPFVREEYIKLCSKNEFKVVDIRYFNKEEFCFSQAKVFRAFGVHPKVKDKLSRLREAMQSSTSRSFALLSEANDKAMNDYGHIYAMENGGVSLGSYTHEKRSYTKFKCKEDAHRPFVLRNDKLFRWCNKCSSRPRMDSEEATIFLKANGYNLISKWTNTTIKVNLICLKCHVLAYKSVWRMRAGSFDCSSCRLLKI